MCEAISASTINVVPFTFISAFEPVKDAVIDVMVDLSSKADAVDALWEL